MEKLTLTSTELADTIKDVIKTGGSFPLEVTGTSMRPFFIQGRDTVWLRRCEQSDFKKGAILLFERRDKTLVLHRVREVLPQGELLMNGDGQTWCEKIAPSQVLAVVGEIERNGKKLRCDTPFNNIKVSLWRGAMPARYYILKLWKMFNGERK
ncbi:MAG: S24/S26 family peptidase [Clostridia bacterium]|nr:S24/S26 family peptidase [Clostridia bacterium]